MLFRYSCQLQFNTSLEDLVESKPIENGFDFIDPVVIYKGNSDHKNE